jgi:hypothetical protein
MLGQHLGPEPGPACNLQDGATSELSPDVLPIGFEHPGSFWREILVSEKRSSCPIVLEHAQLGALRVVVVFHVLVPNLEDLTTLDR